MKTLIITYLILSSVVFAGGEGGGTGVTPVKAEAKLVDFLGVDGGGKLGNIIVQELLRNKLKVKIDSNLKHDFTLETTKNKLILKAKTVENAYEIANKLYEDNKIGQEGFSIISDK